MKETEKVAPDSATPNEVKWHTLGTDEVTTKLGVDPTKGLSSSEVTRRLEQYGVNELETSEVTSPWVLAWEQLTEPMVLILLGAAAVSAVLGQVKELVAIMAIVTINALIGVSQEYRAEQAIAALKKMAAPSVRVRRDGQEIEVSSNAIVPGDVVILDQGAIVPADGRVIEEANLNLQEASLTGESTSVEKHTRALEGDDLSIGDRSNMVYMGTAVTYGRGVVVITNTGMDTELGHIANLIQNVESDKTPLQRRMAELSTALFYIAILIVVAATIIGALNIPSDSTVPFLESMTPIFIAAVAIAVAVVPEGLPAVVTISLALGAQRMLRRRALIRRLPAVETLGSVTVICSDKTGTLTENLMTVTIVDIADDIERIDQVEFQHERRNLFTAKQPLHKPSSLTKALLFTNAALSNDASINRQAAETGEIQVVGDPTEAALLTVAALFGVNKLEVEKILPRVSEVPFSSERKRMSTVHSVEAPLNIELEGKNEIVNPIPDLDGHSPKYIVFTKGAVDELVTVCDSVLINDVAVNMDSKHHERITNANDRMASQGLRVLGLAYRVVDELPEKPDADNIETGLTFCGMVGMIDPPRAEVKKAVQDCTTAGIRPVMITGDHPLTAYAIASELHIVNGEKPHQNGSQKNIITGRQLTQDASQLDDAVEHVSVYARVSPEHKLNIVNALQNKDNIVAMTGDGVNDAPALKRADIGVAMGITGTAVAKEAADMVILDDNFATIVEAVEEGRTIYDNVRKFIKYILASNTGEVITLFATQILGLILPLTTLQILWMNLVTDGLPALALGVEKGEDDIMTRPPYSPKESIFSRGLGWYLVRIGALIGLLGFSVVIFIPVMRESGEAISYFQQFQLAAQGIEVSLPTDMGVRIWSTMIFTTLVFSQMGHAMAIRSERRSLWTIGIFSNRAMLIAVGLTVGLQFLVIYVPFMQDFFQTAALTFEQVVICLVLSLITYVGVEIDKKVFPPKSRAEIVAEANS